MEGDLQTSEDGLQTTEDDLDMLEDDTFFVSFNKDSLNPFKCSEMILNYKGKTIDQVNRMEGALQTTEYDLQMTKDDLQTKEDDLDITEDGQNLLFPFN